MAEQKGRTKMGEEKAGGAARGLPEVSRNQLGRCDRVDYLHIKECFCRNWRPEEASTASAPEEPPEPTPDPEAQRG